MKTIVFMVLVMGLPAHSTEPVKACMEPVIKACFDPEPARGARLKSLAPERSKMAQEAVQSVESTETPAILKHGPKGKRQVVVKDIKDQKDKKKELPKPQYVHTSEGMAKAVYFSESDFENAPKPYISPALKQSILDHSRTPANADEEMDEFN